MFIEDNDREPGLNNFRIGVDLDANNGNSFWSDDEHGHRREELMIYVNVTYLKITSKDTPYRTMHNTLLRRLASEFPLIARLLNRSTLILFNLR